MSQWMIKFFSGSRNPDSVTVTVKLQLLLLVFDIKTLPPLFFLDGNVSVNVSMFFSLQKVIKT